MKEGLSILDALENLNTLVDADSLDEIEVTENSLLIQHKGEEEDPLREVYWVKAGPDTQTLEAIKQTFRCVRDYLETFYHKMKGGDTTKVIAGVNTIMVLVGEAAKKLDRFGSLFKKRVTEIEEYKELQQFYRNEVIKETFREFAKAPIARTKEVLPEQKQWEEELQQLLAEEEEIEEIAGVHILNDIDVIKRDHLYELFYLRNEAGHQFYTYDLARNIKLACDFGEFAEEYFGEDPLLQIKNWEDKSLHILAQKILKRCQRPIEQFYREALRYKEMDAIASTHKAIMALMLAANPRNLIRQFSLKGSHLYFRDFLYFLRETLNSREYQKFLIYSPPTGKPFFNNFIDVVHVLCRALFTLGAAQEEVSEALGQLIDRIEHKKGKILSEHLAQANQALTEALKRHPNGPVFKAVDIIREEEEQAFDPLMQGNIPGPECMINKTQLIRMPCPIYQEWINTANVTEEFKTFLHTLSGEEHLLLFNFQDRTSWKEHARCKAIEELAKQAEFAHVLTVVTLPRETDFYNQAGAYHAIEEASEFINQFFQHLGDESSGYYFPSKIKKALFPEFIDKLLPKIHKTFFKGKTRLSFLERLDFIELTYLLIELKVMELVKPTMITLTSKDGLDIGATSTVELIALITQAERLDFKKINSILFGPTLVQRERVIHPERFDRLLALTRLLEESGDYWKSLASLFESVDFTVLFPKI